MPYKTEWVPAELALEHGGIKIFHTYKDNETDQGERTYWFSPDEDSIDEDSFDVRELPNYSAWKVKGSNVEKVDVLTIIKEAIDLGHIKLSEGVVTVIQQDHEMTWEVE